MYKFKTTSWHVKLFEWIFNEDPTKIYKSMCPYFWSFVLILLTLPLIAVVKMFGKAGTAVLNSLRTSTVSSMLTFPQFIRSKQVAPVFVELSFIELHGFKVLYR